MHMNVEPVGKTWQIKKAWVNPDGSVNVEGWVSTIAQDLEKDIMEPETFAGTPIKDYFAGGAPISVEHNTSSIPVGFVRRSALVRDGNIFQEELNDHHEPLEFKYFDGLGTGWYGLGTVDDEKAADAVMKGKLSFFSWIGMPRAWTPLPGGGRHFAEKGGIDPLIEVTLTAYPINRTARMRIAKAKGLLERPRLQLRPDSVERVLRSI
jgi:hypothetical protein